MPSKQPRKDQAIPGHRTWPRSLLDGKKAGPALQVLAEEGNPDAILVNALSKIGPDFAYAAISLPTFPGQSRNVVLKVDEAHPDVSGVWMLGATNDGFAGIDSVDVYNLKKPVAIHVYALDAGSKKNSEKKEFTAALGGRSLDPEDGVITRHEGIRGDADIPASYKFDPKAPVGRITITPLKAAS
jgi:hypothetical protein